MNIQLVRYHDLGNINTRLAKSLNERQGVLPPLGIAYIASSLQKAGHKVGIIDAVAEFLTKSQVRARIREFQPDVVGITAMTPTFLGTLEAAKIAKEEGAITVVGGVHMNIFSQETLSYDFIDYGIIGEGEEAFIELCAAIEGHAEAENIRGLAYKKGGKINIGSHRIVDDLDALPFPAFHLLPMGKYNSIIGMYPVSTMMSSRGCPYRCSFCYKSPSGRLYRSRSQKNVVDEMELLVKKYKVREIMFYNDLMMPHHVEGLCREILTRKLRVAWETPQRIDLVTPEMLKLMKKAGCRMLRYGVEQGDPEMMLKVEKRITVDKVRKVFKWTRDAGLDSFAYFIIGCAYESKNTIQATINLAKELNPRFVMFTKAVPLPETPLHRIAVRNGLIAEDYWKNFVLGKVNRPIKPFVNNADYWVEKAYKDFYLRPSKMLEQAGRIRNFDDLRKNFSGLLGLLSLKPHS